MNIENYYKVKSRVEEACKRCGRDVNEVTLIAVSKTKPVEDLMKVRETGCIDFGENKVQEMTGKQAIMADPEIHWHLIGHLQKNKVKYLIDNTYLIHSVDSFDLAKKINDEATKKGKTMDILIEVNVAEEDSKFGIKCEETIDLVKEISVLPNVHIKGLMTIAPFTDEPESNRQYFRQLKNLSVDIKTMNIDNVTMSDLSMGMTGDFEVAIEEGATFVRVGTAIFGERDYSI